VVCANILITRPGPQKFCLSFWKKAEASVIETIKVGCHCWFWLPFNYFYLFRIWIFICFSPVAPIVITVRVPTVCLIGIQTCSLGNKIWHDRCLWVVFIPWFIFMNRLEFWPENSLSQIKFIICFFNSSKNTGIVFLLFQTLYDVLTSKIYL